MVRKGQDLGRLHARAAQRGGVVSRADLAECGFSWRATRRRILDGIWQEVGGAVILAPRTSRTPTLGDLGLAWTLQLTFGQSSRISGVLALRRAGWRLPDTVHIVVVPERTAVSIPGVHVLQRAEVPGIADATGAGEVDTLRFVSPREALLDCLTVLPDDDAVELLDAALQRRLLSTAVLAEGIRSRVGRGRRNAAGLRRLLKRATSGSRSEAEQRMAVLLRRSGTGPWTPNLTVRGPQGEIAEIDFAHEGLRIAIEVDGRAFHSDRRSFERDRERQNWISLNGWLVLRFTWEQITERPDEVIAAVCAAVAQRAA